MIMELQKRQLGFVSLPSHKATWHRVVFSVAPVTSLPHQFVFHRVIRTALIGAAADLKMARQICVPKVRAFVVWQQVNRFMHVP